MASGRGFILQWSRSGTGGSVYRAGESYPLCVVTEDRGTIHVSYKGQTYWVCCSGCRDLFNDDPESVLAEAAAREKARAKE